MHQFLNFIFGIKLYMFRTVPLLTIRSFSLYTQQWYMSYRFVEACERTTSNTTCIHEVQSKGKDNCLNVISI